MLPRFIRLDSGAYVNLNFVLSVIVTGASSTWHIQIDYEPGGYTNLDGVWASEADATKALEQIFQPVDVSLY